MKRSHALLSLVAAAILWSTSGILIKSVVWNPLAIAGARSIFAAITLMVLCRPVRLKWTRVEWIAGIAFATNVTLFVSATKLTTAANAILLQYSAPIYVALLGRRTLNEPASRFDWFTIALGICGMGLFFRDRLSSEYLLGNILAIISGMSFAWSTITLRRQKAGSPLHSVILGNLITAVITLPAYFYGKPSAQGMAFLVLLGVFQLGLANFFFVRALQHVNALEAMMVPFIEPVLNPIWVCLFIGERPGNNALVGGVVILASVLLRAAWPLAQRQFRRA